MIQIYINLNENIRKSENEGFFKILNEFLNFHPGGTHLKFLFQSIQKNLFIVIRQKQSLLFGRREAESRSHRLKYNQNYLPFFFYLKAASINSLEAPDYLSNRQNLSKVAESSNRILADEILWVITKI